MKRAVWTRRWALLAAGFACGGSDAVPEQMATDTLPGFEAPVLTNAESPVSYPIDLFEQQVEGTVVLRLYVDERGGVVPESTRIAEGSGYPALDSAALSGVAAMRFAPARRSGRPVPTAFLQPVVFQRPERARSTGGRGGPGGQGGEP